MLGTKQILIGSKITSVKTQYQDKIKMMQYIQVLSQI